MPSAFAIPRAPRPVSRRIAFRTVLCVFAVDPAAHLGRVRRCMNPLELAQRDARVDLRRGEVLVPEHLLDEALSAPFSSISVAIVWRSMWQEPSFPRPAACT